MMFKIIIIIIFFPFLNCKNLINNTPDNIAEESIISEIKNDSNCIILLHSILVDEITDIDESKHFINTYNGLVLYSYVKNLCSDSIFIDIAGGQLNVGIVLSYFQNGGVTTYRADRFIEGKETIPPNDSVLMRITYINEYEVKELDSLNVWVYYNITNKLIWQLVHIDAAKINLKR